VPLLAALTLWLLPRRDESTAGTAIPGTEPGPVVEVLNGTRVDGLARNTTWRLRGAGIDVVYFGMSAFEDLDTTRIVVRRGDPAVAIPIREALGVGSVIVEPDSLLLLDVTVIAGHDLATALGLRP